MNDQEVFRLLDLCPEVKSELLQKIELSSQVRAIRRKLVRINVRYLGENSEFFWFQDGVTDSSFTVKKNQLNEIERAARNVRKLHSIE